MRAKRIGDGNRMRRTRLRVQCVALIASSTLALSAAGQSAHAAIVPAGSFVFDGQVRSIVQSGSNVFVAGTFSKQQAPTGGGLVVAESGSGQPDPSRFPKVAGSVFAVAPDGSGGWFVGGDFARVGAQQRRNLAHILPDGTVDPAWAPNPSGVVLDIATSGSTVYVGGGFSTVAGQQRRNLAALSAATGAAGSWNPSSDGVVFDIAVSGSTVYAGGGFRSVGAQPRRGLAAIDAVTGSVSAWNPSPDGFESVRAIAVSGSSVYVGGTFSLIGGQPRSGLAAIDATTGAATAWNPSTDSQIHALAVSGSTVYVGGFFSSLGGQPRTGLAAVDATTGNATPWNPAADDAVYDLAVSASRVYAAGQFTSIGGQPRSGIASISATTATASAWDPNPSDRVYALATSGSDVYVGGHFAGAGPPVSTVSGVAKLTNAGDLDTSWNPNPSGGGGGGVAALAVAGPTVYAGGSFSSIGGQPRNGLAALDGTTGAATAWNPNLEPFGRVITLAVSGSTLYAGGDFFSAGGQPRRNLAALSTATATATAWNPSPDDQVTRLAVSPSAVYVTGVFSRIGGQVRRAPPGDGAAAIDITTGAATAWNPLPDNQIDAFAIYGSTVFAGGAFGAIGGQSRFRLAGLDATTGNATPFRDMSSSDSSPGALALAGSTLYVGRGFSVNALNADTGAPTALNPVLTGLKFDDVNAINAVAVFGPRVYAAGDFSAVDGLVTGPFAVINDGSAPPLPADTTAPTITIATPTEGQRFAQGTTVAPVFSCDDGSASGVATCAAPAAVDTASAGAKTFTVTATDNAGNSATKTINYRVDAAATAPGPGGAGTVTPSAQAPPSVLGSPSINAPIPGSVVAPSRPMAAATARVVGTATKAQLRRGLLVRVAGGRPSSTVVVQVRRGTRVLATARARIGARGTALPKIRFSSRTLRSLKQRSRLAVRTSFISAAGKRVVRNARVTVR